MQTSQLDGTFINVISPKTGGPSTISAIEEWTRNNHEEVTKRLNTSGALLFRGFDVNTAEDFQRIGLAVNESLATRYPGGAPREKLAKHVWTASETPGHMPISSHCELSYIPNLRPGQILFCCLSAADEGGETPVAKMSDVWESLPKDLRAKIESNDFQVVRQYPESKRRMLDVRRLAGPATAWQDVLGSKDPMVVQSDAQKDGVTLNFWKSGKQPPLLSAVKDRSKILQAIAAIPAVALSVLMAIVNMLHPWPLVEMNEKLLHPESDPEKGSDACVELVTSFSGCRKVGGQQIYGGVDVFFSEYGWAVEAIFVALRTRKLIHVWVAFRILVGTIVFMFLRTFGLIGRAPLDLRICGRSLSLREVIQIDKAYWDNFEFLKWQVGDVLILNNELCSHGRMPFTGKRKVLTAFG